MASRNYDGLWDVTISSGQVAPRRAEFGQAVLIMRDTPVLGRGGKSSIRLYRDLDAWTADYPDGTRQDAGRDFFNNKPGQPLAAAQFNSASGGARVRGKVFGGTASELAGLTGKTLNVGDAAVTVGTGLDGVSDETGIATALQTLIRTITGFTGATVDWDATGKRFTVQYAATRLVAVPLSGTVADYVGLTTGELQTGIATPDTMASAVARVREYMDVESWVLEDISQFTDTDLGFSLSELAAAVDGIHLKDTHEEQVFQAADTTSQLVKANARNLWSGVSATRHTGNYNSMFLAAFFAGRHLDRGGVLRNPNGSIPIGITPDELTQPEYDAAIGKRANIIRDRGTQYSTIIREGMSTVQGMTLDNLYGQLWLKKAIGAALGNLMIGDNWLPLTETGRQLATAAIETVLERGKRNGVIAPSGNFTSGTVARFVALTGNPAFPTFTSTGYFIFSLPVSTITAEHRKQNRQLTDFAIAVIQAETALNINVHIEV